MNKTAIALNIAVIAALLLVAYFIHPAVAIIAYVELAWRRQKKSIEDALKTFALGANILLGRDGQ